MKFSPDPKLYPIVLTRFEGLECMNYSPFIYAFNQQNIAITGGGTLDGQASGEHWWPWAGKRGAKPDDPNQRKARAALMEMAEKGVPVEQRKFGEGGWLRPMFIQPYRCTNVQMEDITITNSPMYEMHPVLCKNVIARNVKVSSHGPNNDGCDPESSVDVLIDGCTFDTGDDCIAIKSGRNADGRRLHAPSENLIVQNCVMKDGHGGVTMGSECSGDIRNVFAQDCQMDSPNLNVALRFKNNAIRGGVIEHVYMRNVKAGQVAQAAIDVDFYYEEGEKGPFTPVVRDVEVINLEVKKCGNAVVAARLQERADPRHPPEELHVRRRDEGRGGGERGRAEAGSRHGERQADHGVTEGPSAAASRYDKWHVMGSFRITFVSGYCCSCVSRIWAADSALILTKTFGGSGNDGIGAVATDHFGNVIVAGSTSSYDFPVTNGSVNTATHFAASPDGGGTLASLEQSAHRHSDFAGGGYQHAAGLVRGRGQRRIPRAPMAVLPGKALGRAACRTAIMCRRFAEFSIS